MNSKRNILDQTFFVYRKIILIRNKEGDYTKQCIGSDWSAEAEQRICYCVQFERKEVKHKKWRENCCYDAADETGQTNFAIMTPHFQ